MYSLNSWSYLRLYTVVMENLEMFIRRRKSQKDKSISIGAKFLKFSNRGAIWWEMTPQAHSWQLMQCMDQSLRESSRILSLWVDQWFILKLQILLEMNCHSHYHWFILLLCHIYSHIYTWIWWIPLENEWSFTIITIK
jgi:hypothetical protein